MAKRQRSVTQLLARLAEAVDLPAFSDAPATYVTQTRAIEYLSDSVHAFAQKHMAFGLLASTTTIAAVSGTKTYNLPNDFAALINLTYPLSGCPQKLRRADVDDIDLEPTTGNMGWAEYGNPKYCILGESLIMSDPKGSYTVTMRYVPELPMFNVGDVAIPDFSAVTDYILCKGAIDQWVVLDSAIKINRKQQIDPTPLIQSRNEIELNLLNNVTDRNAHDAGTVRNTWDIQGGGDY